MIIVFDHFKFGSAYDQKKTYCESACLTDMKICTLANFLLYLINVFLECNILVSIVLNSSLLLPILYCSFVSIFHNFLKSLFVFLIITNEMPGVIACSYFTI